MKLTSRIRPLTIVGLFFGLVGTSFSATVIANFDGGTSTTVVDAYTGIAGSGWAGAWTTASVNGTSVSGAISTFTPFVSGSGNYLVGTIKGPTNASPNPQAYIGRVVDDAAFDYAQPIQVSFLFRPVDALTGSQQYRILGDEGTMTGATGPSNLFVIDSGLTATPTWRFGGTGSTVDSGMTVTANVNYSFTLTLDMQTKSYVATVINLSTSDSYTSESIGFRYTDVIGDFALQFGALLSTSGNQTSANQLRFAVDNIALSNIPEPSTIAVMAGLAAGLAGVGFRRRSLGNMVE